MFDLAIRCKGLSKQYRIGEQESYKALPEWRALYGLNPMAGVVEGFRWALLGKQQPSGAMLWVSVAVVILLLVGGLYYFRRMEQQFADVV